MPAEPPPRSIPSWDKNYFRERSNPSPADPLYLVLSDLKTALERVAPRDAKTVLDYGCGGSPYRYLFGGAKYCRADLHQGEGVDYKIDDHQGVSAASGSFDVVLSTQVAEHVRDVGPYFAEIFRLTRPGGLTIITTHGTFEDHGVPFDFQRWTAEGLIRDMELAGFREIEILRTTTSFRAVLFLLDSVLSDGSPLRGKFAYALQRFAAFIMQRSRCWLNRAADCFLDEQKVAPKRGRFTGLYICLVATGKRPEVGDTR